MRVGLAEAAHSLGVPGPQHGGNHSRENRRKYRQKRENTTKMSAKKRKAGGDTSHRAQGEEGVSLRGFCGWIQRDSTETHGPSGCCSLLSVCTSTSPQCHNYIEQLASFTIPFPGTEPRPQSCVLKSLLLSYSYLQLTAVLPACSWWIITQQSAEAGAHLPRPLHSE